VCQRGTKNDQDQRKSNVEVVMFAFISLVHIPNLLIRQTIIALTSHARGLCRTFSASCHEIACPCAEHSPPPLPSSLLIQPEVFGRWDNAERVGVAHSSSPALDTDHRVALVKDTKLNGIHDSPLQTAVNIFLPWGGVEVRLLLGEIERIYATIQMGILPELAKISFMGILKLTRAAMALRVTMMIGQTGRYLETRRAVVPLIYVSNIDMIQ
jgi:hypothetical protein